MCSIEEAFQTEGFDRSPAFRRDGRDAMRDPDRERKKEKRRLKEAFRTRLPPPEPSVIEPDRPAHKQLPPAELLGGAPTEFTQSTSTSQILNAYDSEPYFPHPHADNKQEGLYELGQDWTKVFQSESAPSWIRERMSQRVAEVPLKPAPWMDGAPTLWQSVPAIQQGDPVLKAAEVKTTSQLDEMQRKLDHMFAKLDALENSRAETNHIEIILFVLGGIFLIFILDLLVRHAIQASMVFQGANLQGGAVVRALW